MKSTSPRAAAAGSSTKPSGAVLLLLGSLLLKAPAAYANSGDLDQTFGFVGRVTTYALSAVGGVAVSAVGGVAVQGDGKLVLAGGTRCGSYGGGCIGVVRYNPDGSPDVGFGSGGEATTSIGVSVSAFALAIQQDGGIVTAGTAFLQTPHGGPTVFALTRYQPDGSSDPTFGPGGVVTTPIGEMVSGLTNTAFVSALVVQADGKLVAAGSTTDQAGHFRFALARYNPNGSMDEAFGTGGVVTTSVGGYDDWAAAVVQQPDGKLVAAGFAEALPPSPLVFALVRYNVDGSPDATFGHNGIVATSIPGLLSGTANALAIQADGRLIAAGSTGVSNGTDFALARYNPDGSLDGTFGTGGIVTTDLSNASAAAVAVLPDGRIVAAGTSGLSSSGGGEFAVVRYNPNGTLDPRFGAGGVVTTVFAPNNCSVARALAVQADGKLIVTGTAGCYGEAVGMVRYLYSSCGNGEREWPEQCDDGPANGTLTSCCTASCMFQPSGTPCTGGTCGGTGDTCVPVTTSPSPTPTTTTLPCTTARCTLDAALRSAACAGQTIPTTVSGALTSAETLIEQAATTPGKKARKARQRARKLLRQADLKATRAAKGKKAKLSPACATVLSDAARRVAADL
jgi:uncharacterized delta-60 repeat protein